MHIMGKEVPTADMPIIKLLGWVISIVVGTLGAWLWLDSYFVRRAEAASMKKEYTEQIAQVVAANNAQVNELKMQIEYSADQNAKRAIDNQLFQLEQIPQDKLKPQDRALYEKLKRDRAELVNLWNRRGRPLR